MPMMPTLGERCSATKLLILDVDGVLTDGGIIYSEDGGEIKRFHVRDGSGIKLWTQIGRQAAIITGRRSRLVERRAVELGIAPVIQGAADKLAAVQDLMRDLSLTRDQVCAVGDDLPDLPVLCQAGLAVAVADACPEVIAAAHYVTHTPGGQGAVREVIEMILRCQGEWQKLVERLRTPA